LVDAHEMFCHSESFNCNLSTWDVGLLKNARQMFFNAISFCGDLSAWKLPNLINATYFAKGSAILKVSNKIAVKM